MVHDHNVEMYNLAVTDIAGNRARAVSINGVRANGRRGKDQASKVCSVRRGKISRSIEGLDARYSNWNSVAGRDWWWASSDQPIAGSAVAAMKCSQAASILSIYFGHETAWMLIPGKNQYHH